MDTFDENLDVEKGPVKTFTNKVDGGVNTDYDFTDDTKNSTVSSQRKK